MSNLETGHLIHTVTMLQEYDRDLSLLIRILQNIEGTFK